MCFLLGGKKAKIPFKSLQNSKKHAGQKLVDLRLKQKALRIHWVQEVLNNPFYSEYVYFNLDNQIMEKIWECNLNKKDVKYVTKIPSFWKSVLEDWCDVHFHEPQSKRT